MGGITHSEAVVFRRSVWYLLLMLVVGLFTRNLTNEEGKTIEAEILGRPELDTVKFRRVSDNLIFTIPLSTLHNDDSEFVKTLPFHPNE